MSSSNFHRPIVSKPSVFLLLLLLGLATGSCEGAGELGSAPSSEPHNASRDVHRSLREFDRFLDHHPLLEEQLRLNRQLTANKAFLSINPELGDFLRAHPQVVGGLEVYPRYFLNRALVREASEPISRTDLAPLKDLFQQEPALEHALTEHPELIRDAHFLQANAPLHHLLQKNTILARVFLPPASTTPTPN